MGVLGCVGIGFKLVFSRENIAQQASDDVEGREYKSKNDKEPHTGGGSDLEDLVKSS